MDENKWIAWKIQTSKTWSDMDDVLCYTNIDFIDFDHKTLVEYALQLNQLISRTESDFSIEALEEIGRILTKLYDYAVGHFNREEVFMSKYNLPGVDSHKIEHKRILEMLKTSINDFNRGKIKVSDKLKVQIMDWLIQHINGTDYIFFDIKNWSENLIEASDWMEVRDIIKLTGISDIDEQHKKLTEIAIKTMCEINEDTPDNIIMKLFAGFKDYVVFHFGYEAKFMAKYGLIDTKEHLDMHNYFLKRLDEFPLELIRDSSKLNEFKLWTLTWWIKHINITDKETFAYKSWAYKVIENAESIDDVLTILRYTDISTIDHAHVELMEATFELNKMITEYTKDKKAQYNEDSKKAIVSMFEKIYAIAEKHFMKEEQIMKRHNFADYNSQAHEHKLILEKIKNILTNYQENRLYVSTNIKTMILDWWLNHTNNIDYRTFVTNLEEPLREIIIKEELQHE